MDEATAEAIRRWKVRKYRETDLPFQEAVDSLVSEEPLIEARQSDTRPTDWVLCRYGTAIPALFVFAAVFADADPYDTGNLLQPKAPLPRGWGESRAARHAGYKAAYSYGFDTYHDKDIWMIFEALDAYMTNVEGFNPRQMKRRVWQDGGTYTSRYWLKVPMFLTSESRGAQQPAPEGLHEWVTAAHDRSVGYRANPVWPRVCGLNEGRLQSIADCTPNVLEYGDVVSLVFSVVYVEDRDDWGPVPMMTHIVRVQNANRLAYPLSAAVIDTDPGLDVEGLQLGVVVDAEQAAEAEAARARTAVAAQAAGTGSGVEQAGVAPRAEGAGVGAPVPKGIHGGKAVQLTRAPLGAVTLPNVGIMQTAPGPVPANPGKEGRSENRQSGFEMEVDDDARERGPVGHIAGPFAADDDGGASSGGSTTTEASADGLSAAGRGWGGGTKRRTRDSEDDSVERAKAGRGGGSAGGRRGAKAAKPSKG